MRANHRHLLAAPLLMLATTVAANSGADGPLLPGETLPGGAATYTGPLDRNAFSHPSATLEGAGRMDFTVGNGFFKRLWVSAPASTQAADGLGPLFNARSCQSCHVADGRGRPPAGPDDKAVSLFLRLSIPAQTKAQRRKLAQGLLNAIPEPTYGLQLQNFAVRGHHAEGRLRVRYEPVPVSLADGEVIALRRPSYTVAEPAYGPLHPDTMLSPRLAPPMIGLGLLEAIPEAAILGHADPDDADGDGITGRPNRVRDPGSGAMVLGRFGWKAGSSSVDAQSQAAFAGDIGISVPQHRNGAGDCTEHQGACRAAPDGNSPQFDDLEAPARVTDLVAHYARHLAVPARRGADDPEVLAGRALFHRLGCAACHTPSHTTAGDAGDPALAGQRIWPYTDLLLHDMGPGLADGRPEGRANGREWRTAPLWGIGLTEQVNGHGFYLHDGRARSLLEAILWHGGEARAAREAVAGLPTAQREQLLRFLESL